MVIGQKLDRITWARSEFEFQQKKMNVAQIDFPWNAWNGLKLFSLYLI